MHAFTYLQSFMRKHIESFLGSPGNINAVSASYKCWRAAHLDNAQAPQARSELTAFFGITGAFLIGTEMV